MKAQKGSRVTDLLVLLLRRYMGVSGQPGRFTPAKETLYPLYRWLDEHQYQSELTRKISFHRDSIPGTSSP